MTQRAGKVKALTAEMEGSLFPNETNRIFYQLAIPSMLTDGSEAPEIWDSRIKDFTYQDFITGKKFITNDFGGYVFNGEKYEEYINLNKTFQAIWYQIDFIFELNPTQNVMYFSQQTGDLSSFGLRVFSAANSNIITIQVADNLINTFEAVEGQQYRLDFIANCLEYSSSWPIYFSWAKDGELQDFLSATTASDSYRPWAAIGGPELIGTDKYVIPSQLLGLRIMTYYDAWMNRSTLVEEIKKFYNNGRPLEYIPDPSYYSDPTILTRQPKIIDEYYLSSLDEDGSWVSNLTSFLAQPVPTSQVSVQLEYASEDKSVLFNAVNTINVAEGELLLTAINEVKGRIDNGELIVTTNDDNQGGYIIDQNGKLVFNAIVGDDSSNYVLSEVGDLLFLEIPFRLTGNPLTIIEQTWSFNQENAVNDLEIQVRFTVDGIFWSDWFNALADANYIGNFDYIDSEGLMQVRMRRTGSTIDGDISWEKYEAYGTFNNNRPQDFPTTKDSIFGDILNDEATLKLADNLFKKLYFRGIVPQYITRGDNRDRDEDRDYISLSKTIGWYYSLFIRFAARFENIFTDFVLLREWVRQSGLYFDESAVTIEDLQYLSQYFWDEIRKRGTSMIFRRKGEILPDGSIVEVDGEYLRLLRNKVGDEQLFEVLPKEKVGWVLGHSSPCYRGTSKSTALNKTLEKTQDFQNLANFQLTKEGGLEGVSLVEEDNKTVARITPLVSAITALDTSQSGFLVRSFTNNNGLWLNTDGCGTVQIVFRTKEVVNSDTKQYIANFSIQDNQPSEGVRLYIQNGRLYGMNYSSRNSGADTEANKIPLDNDTTGLRSNSLYCVVFSWHIKPNENQSTGYNPWYTQLFYVDNLSRNFYQRCNVNNYMAGGSRSFYYGPNNTYLAGGVSGSGVQTSFGLGANRSNNNPADIHLMMMRWWNYSMSNADMLLLYNNGNPMGYQIPESQYVTVNDCINITQTSVDNGDLRLEIQGTLFEGTVLSTASLLVRVMPAANWSSDSIIRIYSKHIKPGQQYRIIFAGVGNTWADGGTNGHNPPRASICGGESFGAFPRVTNSSASVAYNTFGLLLTAGESVNSAGEGYISIWYETQAQVPPAITSSKQFIMYQIQPVGLIREYTYDKVQTNSWPNNVNNSDVNTVTPFDPDLLIIERDDNPPVGFGRGNDSEEVTDLIYNVEPRLDYEITFQFKCPQTSEGVLKFSVEAFDQYKNKLFDAFILPTGTYSNGEFVELNVSSDKFVGGQWYEVRGIIHAYGSQNMTTTQLNIGYGQNLYFHNSFIKYILPKIQIEELSSGFYLDIWDYKIRPLVRGTNIVPMKGETNENAHSLGFIQAKQIIYTYSKNNNKSYDNEELQDIIRKYLIPYNVSYIFNFL